MRTTLHIYTLEKQAACSVEAWVST